jgi:hypothetical protein
MTYFSLDNGRFAGDSKALAVFHLFTGAKPLVYGLLSGVGRPLTLLSDGIELRAAVLIVESLTLSAVDWLEPIYDLLTDPRLESPPRELLSPADIIDRVAYDGRFSGVMKAGPGFHGVARVLSNPSARAAVVEYVQQLECGDMALLLQKLSDLAVVLLCATHKPEKPAFDYYLAHISICVNNTRIIFENLLEERSHRIVLIRGIWLLIILTYITQLRPIIDTSLLTAIEEPGGDMSWDSIHQEFHSQGISGGKYNDPVFLRTLRSLWELDKAYGPTHGSPYLQAARKMVSQWDGWTGIGADREAVLNIRL